MPNLSSSMMTMSAPLRRKCRISQYLEGRRLTMRTAYTHTKIPPILSLTGKRNLSCCRKAFLTSPSRLASFPSQWLTSTHSKRVWKTFGDVPTNSASSGPKLEKNLRRHLGGKSCLKRARALRVAYPHPHTRCPLLTQKSCTAC
jgi:hypothetical protein